jgi:pyruvate/2-oxoglutarate dehydrogenase complex dihydrolipoamide acyltransferase (E2) component
MGIFGIEAYTPIINTPEVAILGVGRIVPELVLVDGQVVVRDLMTLSLTVDHRIVDGAPGAEFCRRWFSTWSIRPCCLPIGRHRSWPRCRIW